MKYLHTMIRVKNLEKSLDFFINKLGLIEVRRKDIPEGRYTLVFLATEENESLLELTYNWDKSVPYSIGENFGHIAYGVNNIYDVCDRLRDEGVTILRPPRDGKMDFIRSPDQISIELIQIGEPLPRKEPWISLENKGSW